MFDILIEWDRQLFVYLNGLGSRPFDNFWFYLTDQKHWIPLFVFILVVAFKNVSRKEFWVIVVFLGFIGLLTDQSSNLIKNTFERLRPNNDSTLINIRILKHPQSYSFISNHASNSMAFTMFVVLLLRKKIKSIKWLFLWPLTFAYSRIYLGLHFPLDIIGGFIWGAISGVLHYKGFVWVREKYQLQHSSNS